VQSALLESDDGLIWRHAGLFQETYGDETAFLFEDDGSNLAVARSGGGRNAQVCRAEPPYTKFTGKDLDRYIGGPLLKKWNGRYLVGGRNMQKKRPYTSLCWLTGETLHEFAAIPSAGDNSYPGFVLLSNKRALISYYSSHEKRGDGRPMTAVFLAELLLEK
jgi:hypothetical protein